MDQVLVVAQAFDPAHLKVNERILVVTRFEFAQSQHSPSWTVLRAERRQIVKCPDSFPIKVAIVIQRPEIPPSFVPAGVKLKSFPIQVNGLLRAIPLAGLGCLVGNPLELRRGSRWRGLRRLLVDGAARLDRRNPASRKARSIAYRGPSAPGRHRRRQACRFGRLSMKVN